MEKLKEVLYSHGYNDKQVVSVMNRLCAIDGSLKNYLQEWVNEGKVADVVICDISLKSLMSKYDMEYPAALLTMDWLIREPEKAIRSINRGVR